MNKSRRRTIKIKREPTVRIYTVTKDVTLKPTEPRQEPIIRSVRIKKYKNSVKRLTAPTSHKRTRRVNSRLVGKLYAKAIHTSDKLAEMIKYIETTTHTRPVKNAVIRRLEEDYEE